MFFLLFVIFSVLSYFDIKYRIIPNVVTLPFILFGCLMTGNWILSVMMSLIMTVFYYFKLFAGGDVKIMTMAASFLGADAFILFGISIFALSIYNMIKRGPLPFAPFVLFGFLVSSVYK